MKYIIGLDPQILGNPIVNGLPNLRPNNLWNFLEIKI
jgi:hypothetical protein